MKHLAVLGDMAALITKGTTPTTYGYSYTDKGVRFVKAESLANLRINHALCSFVSSEAHSAFKRSQLREGDILFTIAGTLGRVAVVRREDLPANTNQAVAIVRLKNPEEAEYVARFLATADAVEAGGRGTGLQNLNLQQVSAITVPSRPLAEQRLILAKLDTLFVRSRRSREELVRIPGLVERARSAVFEGAATGTITASWRTNRTLPDSLQDSRASTTKDTKLEAGQSLPAGWRRISVGEAGEVVLGRQRSPQHHTGKHMRPYLRVANVFEDRIDVSDVMTMNFTPEEFKKFKLMPRDILLNEGQSKELVGRPAMFMDELADVCFTNTLVRFRAHQHVTPEYALLVFRHYLRSGQFESIAKITTNIAHLGAGRFAALPFPIPPLAEQEEIIRRSTERLAALDKAIEEVTKAGALLNRLDQAMLAKAFSGELVPLNAKPIHRYRA